MIEKSLITVAAKREGVRLTTYWLTPIKKMCNLAKNPTDMQYDVQTPSEYIKALEEGWRKEKLQELRQLILSKAPEIEESIQYKMLAYGDNEKAVFHLNAQKNYVSLYVGNIRKVDPEEALLTGLNVGKGCIRLSKSKAVADTKLDAFIERTVELWRQGKDTAC